MKVKYKNILTWKIMALVWFALAGFVYIRWVANAPDEFLIQRAVFVLGLVIIIGIYYLMMPRISYVILDEQRISIHKSSVIIRQKIKKENLECCRVKERDLEFYLKNGKSYAIHLDWCEKDQVIAFIRKLQAFVNVYEGNTNKSVNLKDIDSIS